MPALFTVLNMIAQWMLSAHTLQTCVHVCNALASTQRSTEYLPDPNSSILPCRVVQGWILGSSPPFYFGPLKFLKGKQSLGQRHFREPCSSMRDLAETHAKTVVHTCHVKTWAVRWNAGCLGSNGRNQSHPHPISFSDHLAPLATLEAAATVVSVWSYSFTMQGKPVMTDNISVYIWAPSQELSGNRGNVMEPKGTSPFFIAL